ncbi:hypothetical protein GGF32_002384 [Allomyces javanicus]|nr:hypothetical protein GGF32_002384 [Allomyces javanicus]
MSSTQHSLRLVPGSSATDGTHALPNSHAEYGVVDTLRYGLASVKQQVSAHHPLERVLAQADDLQFQRSLALQRTVYGLHAPLRLQMERTLVNLKPAIPGMPSRNLALEVLSGKDETLDVEDFLGAQDKVEDIDFHAAMERKLGIQL